MTWKKRARRNSAGSRYWQTEDFRYMVHCSECCFGVELVPIYVAWVQGKWECYRKISRHRSRAAAVKACEKHERAKAEGADE